MIPSVWWRWAVVLVPGLLLYWFPVPGLNQQQGRLLGVFVATIIALVAQPVRMGVTVVIAMTVLAFTFTLPPAKILSGFSNVTVWLVFTAFLFSRAVTSTGFGTRAAAAWCSRSHAVCHWHSVPNRGPRRNGSARFWCWCPFTLPMRLPRSI